MIRRPPRSTRTDTLFPYTTLFRSSATVEMTERVRAARASGRKIFGLSSGDPNIETDPRIVAAAEQAIRNGDTHYGPAAGIPALREAIVAREARRPAAASATAHLIATPARSFHLRNPFTAVEI